MKIFIYILMGLAFALIVLNIVQLDFNNLSNEKSTINLICIGAALCALLILLILNTAKKIDQKTTK